MEVAWCKHVSRKLIGLQVAKWRQTEVNVSRVDANQRTLRGSALLDDIQSFLSAFFVNNTMKSKFPSWIHFREVTSDLSMLFLCAFAYSVIEFISLSCLVIKSLNQLKVQMSQD